MRWKGRRRPPGPQSIPVDTRVPPATSWPFHGVVGQIRRGPNQGEWVYADPTRDADAAGPILGYILELPHRQLLSLDGTHLIDDGAYDEFRSSREGGFIDLITTALDIEWSTDEATITRVLKENWPGLESSASAKR